MRSHIDNVTIYLEISRTTRRSNTQKRVDEEKKIIKLWVEINEVETNK